MERSRSRGENLQQSLEERRTIQTDPYSNMADSAVHLQQVASYQQSSPEVVDAYGYHQSAVVDSPQYRGSGDPIHVLQSMSAEQVLENNR